MTNRPRAHVLIVDDDASTRKLQRRVLEQGGYGVTEATGAAHALALFNAGTRPDLLITDVDMPGMPGEAMVRRIHAIHPEQRVLYVTAKIHRILAMPRHVRDGGMFLDKPFTSKALVEAVSRVLTAPTESKASVPAAADIESKETFAAPVPHRRKSGGAAISVLAVDDSGANVELIRRALPATEFRIRTASTCDEAVNALGKEAPDVIVVDVRKPRGNGFELCRQVRRGDARLVPIVLVAANFEAAERLRAMDAGVDDFIAEPINPVELLARLRTLARLKRHTEELDTAEQVLVNLGLNIEARDSYTQGHCQRLARYATAMGEALKLDQDELSALQRGAYLHDIGKLGIPDTLLLKPGPLTRAEFATMQSHALVGEQLCGGLRSLARVRPIVRHHHERLDGSGYPDGLRGDRIPLLAEIIGLVDVYDALTTTRPYQAAMPFDRAADALREQARRGWRRREMVQLLLDLVDSQSAVRRPLTDGRVQGAPLS